MAWKTVSPEEARQVPHYGFGGWLLAFYIGLIIYLVVWILAFFLPAPPQWDPGLYQANIALTIVLWLPFLFLAPRKEPMMPKVTISLMWLSLAISWLIYFRATSFEIALVIPILVIGVAFALLMTWYFRSSKRVNVTYRHRVRA